MQDNSEPMPAGDFDDDTQPHDVRALRLVVSG
jgi:hypothetical protein